MRRIIAAIGLIFCACGTERSPLNASNAAPIVPQLTYQTDVRPLLERCVSCHGATQPAGSYDLSTWRGLLGPGSDHIIRNAIPGDKSSVLLSTLENANDTKHRDLLSSDELETLRNWVVSDKLAYFDTPYHPPTWLYPGNRNSTAFHGGFLRSQGWNLDPCRKCHGANLDGGSANRPCTKCHTQSVMNCSTCHGTIGSLVPIPDLMWGIDPHQETGLGAHQVHASQNLFAPIECSDCHVVPETVDAPGHWFDLPETKQTDLHAEVTFAPRAARETTASYSRESYTCTVSCHGAGLDANQQINSHPSWIGPGGNCGQLCHSVPMVGVGGEHCTYCHQQSVESCAPGSADCLTTGKGVGVRFKSRLLHGDGRTPLGKTGVGEACYGCHGTEESGGAPGPDLAGNTDISSVTVGLHQLHLKAIGGFSVPAKTAPCEACHKVPKNPRDAGHFDSNTPGEVTFGAQATGAMALSGLDLHPSWNRNSATCTNTFCHSLSGAEKKTWTWTSRFQGGLNCRSCHGYPPATKPDGSTHTLSTSCSQSGCHAPAYKNGALDPTRHMDGIVEVGP